MRRIGSLGAVALAAVLMNAPQVEAQEAAGVLESELRALAAEPVASDRDRETVAEFLARDDVRGTAETHGLSVETLRNGVATLEADEAADLAQRVRDLEDELPQEGDRFVISSTAVIIALLIIILVLVA